MNNPHHRHRQFNTRDTYPEQRLDNDLCQVVVARGTMVFVRGQVGQSIDGDGDSDGVAGDGVAPADAGAQAEQAMRNLTRLLREVGAELNHICRIQIYLTDRKHREAVYRVVGKHLRGVYPVSTGLIVSGLARPEWVMEIEATAVIPEAESAPSLSQSPSAPSPSSPSPPPLNRTRGWQDGDRTRGRQDELPRPQSVKRAHTPSPSQSPPSSTPSQP